MVGCLVTTPAPLAPWLGVHWNPRALEVVATGKPVFVERVKDPSFGLGSHKEGPHGPL